MRRKYQQIQKGIQREPKNACKKGHPINGILYAFCPLNAPI
jgi:hypothetical protein